MNPDELLIAQKEKVEQLKSAYEREKQILEIMEANQEKEKK
jgi:hypothetical protein